MPEEDDKGPRRWGVVAALGVTQVVSWGSLYYAFAVVMEEVRRDLAISSPVAVGAYCVALLVSGIVAAPVGRHIDRHGAMRAMTAGSVAAALLLAALSQVGSVIALYAVWAGLGVAMGLVLYEPAFASLALVFRADLRKAITVLTLAGGFASTVFWPLTQWLATALGWREAVLVLAGLNLFLCVPLLASATWLSGPMSYVLLTAGGFFLGSTLPVNITYAHMIAPVATGTVSSLMMGVAWGVGGMAVPLVGLAGDRVGLGPALLLLAFLPAVGALITLALPSGRSHAVAVERAATPD